MFDLCNLCLSSHYLLTGSTRLAVPEVVLAALVHAIEITIGVTAGSTGQGKTSHPVYVRFILIGRFLLMCDKQSIVIAPSSWADWHIILPSFLLII